MAKSINLKKLYTNTLSKKGQTKVNMNAANTCSSLSDTDADNFTVRNPCKSRWRFTNLICSGKSIDSCFVYSLLQIALHSIRLCIIMVTAKKIFYNVQSINTKLTLNTPRLFHLPEIHL